MSVTFTAVVDGEAKEHESVACFHRVCHFWPDALPRKTGEPELKILFTPGKDDFGFLQDAVTSEGPIKTALEHINNLSGFECIDLATGVAKVYNNIPYRAALFVLSLARMTTEQPSLMQRYGEIKDSCLSFTDAFLWAYHSCSTYKQYSGHDIVNYSPRCVMNSSKRVAEIFKTKSYLENMQNILSDPRVPVAALYPTGVNNSDAYLDRAYFLKVQQVTMKRMEELKYDLNNYTTT